MVQTLIDYRNQVNELEAKLAAQSADMEDLFTMGAVVTSMLEIGSILSVVMDMSLRVVNGEVGMILMQEGEELKVAVSWGIQENFARSLLYEQQMDLPKYVYENGEAIILNDIDITDEDGRSISEIICMPIKTAKSKHGVLIIINRSNGEGFNETHRDTLGLLLNFVAVAIDNSILVQSKLEKQKMDQEILIAKQIQETILPDNISEIGGVEIGVAYFPYHDVGGDFYDIVKIDDASFISIIGDVSNKGVPAAMVMSAASGISKSIIKNNPDISVDQLAFQLNNLLCDEIIKDREMFITLFLCKFNLAEHKLEYCNAGHIPGLFWDHNDKRIHELAIGGSIVGQFKNLEFKYGKRGLDSGDRLLLFTDGLTEAADSEGRLFGRERVEQVFSNDIGLPPAEFCKQVKEWVDNFSQGSSEDTHDDFTIMQIKVK